MLYAPDLKKMFGIYGHFYNITFGQTVYPCRSTLDIVHHDITPLLINEILSSSPELLVIMMNPGGSRPLDPTYKPAHLQSFHELLPVKELVPAVPDATQYQIMRVMAACNINHARIHNLSDLRDPKSPIFLEKMWALNNAGYTEHSIFDVARADEIDPVLNNHKVKILVGWGRDAALLPLAQQCLRRINGRQCFGMAVDKEQHLYAHPSPMLQKLKDRWLEHVLVQMKNCSLLSA